MRKTPPATIPLEYDYQLRMSPSSSSTAAANYYENQTTSLFGDPVPPPSEDFLDNLDGHLYGSLRRSSIVRDFPKPNSFDPTRVDNMSPTSNPIQVVGSDVRRLESPRMGSGRIFPREPQSHGTYLRPEIRVLPGSDSSSDSRTSPIGGGGDGETDGNIMERRTSSRGHVEVDSDIVYHQPYQDFNWNTSSRIREYSKNYQEEEDIFREDIESDKRPLRRIFSNDTFQYNRQMSNESYTSSEWFKPISSYPEWTRIPRLRPSSKNVMSIKHNSQLQQESPVATLIHDSNGSSSSDERVLPSSNREISRIERQETPIQVRSKISQQQQKTETELLSLTNEPKPPIGLPPVAPKRDVSPVIFTNAITTGADYRVSPPRPHKKTSFTIITEKSPQSSRAQSPHQMISGQSSLPRPSSQPTLSTSTSRLRLPVIGSASNINTSDDSPRPSVQFNMSSFSGRISPSKAAQAKGILHKKTEQDGLRRSLTKRVRSFDALPRITGPLGSQIPRLPGRKLNKSSLDLSVGKTETEMEAPKLFVNPNPTSRQKGLLRVINSADNSPSRIPVRTNLTASMDDLTLTRRASLSPVRTDKRKESSTSPERRSSTQTEPRSSIVSLTSDRRSSNISSVTTSDFSFRRPSIQGASGPPPKRRQSIFQASQNKLTPTAVSSRNTGINRGPRKVAKPTTLSPIIGTPNKEGPSSSEDIENERINSGSTKIPIREGSNLPSATNSRVASRSNSRANSRTPSVVNSRSNSPTKDFINISQNNSRISSRSPSRATSRPPSKHTSRPASRSNSRQESRIQSRSNSRLSQRESKESPVKRKSTSPPKSRKSSSLKSRTSSPKKPDRKSLNPSKSSSPNISGSNSLSKKSSPDRKKDPLKRSSSIRKEPASAKKMTSNIRKPESSVKRTPSIVRKEMNLKKENSNLKRSTSNLKQENLKRETSSLSKNPSSISLKREASNLNRTETGLKREQSSIKKKSTAALKRNTSSSKLDSGEKSEKKDATTTKSGSGAKKGPPNLIKKRTDSNLGKKLEKKNSFRNEKKSPDEEADKNAPTTEDAAEDASEPQEPTGADSGGKLVPLTKQNVISMTTAAITAQPVQITTAVTNQMPLSKTNSNPQLMGNTEETTASNMLTDEVKDMLPAAILERSTKTLETIQKTVAEATEEIQKTINENLSDLKTLDIGKIVDDAGVTNTPVPFEKSDSLRTIIENPEATLPNSQQSDNSSNTQQPANSPMPPSQPIEAEVSVISKKSSSDKLLSPNVNHNNNNNNESSTSSSENHSELGKNVNNNNNNNSSKNNLEDMAERVSERAISVLPEVECESENLQNYDEHEDIIGSEKPITKDDNPKTMRSIGEDGDNRERKKESDDDNDNNNKGSDSQEYLDEENPPTGCCGKSKCGKCCSRFCMPCRRCQCSKCCRRKQKSEMETAVIATEVDEKSSNSCWKRMKCCQKNAKKQSSTNERIQKKTMETISEESETGAGSRSGSSLKDQQQQQKQNKCRLCLNKFFCCKATNKVEATITEAEEEVKKCCFCIPCKKKKTQDSRAWQEQQQQQERRESILSEPPPPGVKQTKFLEKLMCWKKPKPASESRRTSMQSKKQSIAPTLPPEDTRPKLHVDLVEFNSKMKGAIPVMPLPLAWFCMICNCLIPGFGTILSGFFCLCVGIPRFSQYDSAKARIGSLIINCIVGIAQIFCVLFCFVGWGWSIWWGTIMLKTARKLRKIRKVERLEVEEEQRQAAAAAAAASQTVGDRDVEAAKP